MKISTISIALTLFVTISITAQPTITRGWLGGIGDKLNTTFSMNVPDPGPDGANQTWDFSGITPDTLSVNFEYIDPAGTPSGDSYPSSNICLAETSFGIYGYLFLDDDKFENYGSAFVISETIYSDPETQLVFPMGYDDKFVDDYAYSASQFGVTTHGTGTVTGEADGYGTLILPNGTFDNVMRVKVVDEGVDSTDLGLGIIEKVISTTTTYYWYSSDHPGPLCIRDHTEGLQIAIVDALPNDTLAFDPDSSFSFDPTATTSAAEFFQANAFELKATPNPFRDKLNLNFTTDAAGELQFELRNSLGQIITQTTIQATSGINNLEVDAGAYPAGSYFAILKDRSAGSVISVLKTE